MKKPMKMLYLLMLVIFMTSASSLSAANTNTLVWSDNFNDGDHTGWEIIGHDWRNYPGSFSTWAGNASVINNELWINETNEDLYTVAGYPSSVTHGTWSFDIYTENSALILVASNFNVTSYTPNAGRGYRLVLSGTNIVFTRDIGLNEYTLGAYFPKTGSMLKRWQHIDITKDISDRILVYVNGTPRISSTEDTIITSTHFQFISETISGLDNVTVSDSVDITPTTTTTTTSAITPTTTTTTTSTVGFNYTSAALLFFATCTIIIFSRRNRRKK